MITGLEEVIIKRMDLHPIPLSYSRSIFKSPLPWNMNKSERDLHKEMKELLYFDSRFNFLRVHNGLRKSQYHLLIGPSGCGKSSLCRSVVADCAKHENAREDKQPTLWPRVEVRTASSIPLKRRTTDRTKLLVCLEQAQNSASFLARFIIRLEFNLRLLFGIPGLFDSKWQAFLCV